MITEQGGDATLRQHTVDSCSGRRLAALNQRFRRSPPVLDRDQGEYIYDEPHTVPVDAEIVGHQRGASTTIPPTRIACNCRISANTLSRTLRAKPLPKIADCPVSRHPRVWGTTTVGFGRQVVRVGGKGFAASEAGGGSPCKDPSAPLAAHARTGTVQPRGHLMSMDEDQSSMY